ncbi:MAG: rhomboid family intramembrane serine protease [Proteobacteria bacterium]|nr:rhomboid family intramembrane serine protease [Pseudomonadota bacterium]MBU4298034.1 rhomboid family intramembrane serine protease [Pseudomonadota bacterium]MCG2749455.1 rhomboid family intramembrane serine protease [Desulfobulbaceae bacterium]
MTENDNWVPVARIKKYQQAYIWSLVLQAVNIPHVLEKEQDYWLITVDQQFKAAAVGHISSFEQENRNWPPPKEEPVGLFSFRDRQPPTLLLMGMLLIFFWVTGSWQDGSSWFSSGAVDLRQIVDHGQWWRLVTGLTLHADPVHVLGNVIIGGIIIHFLCKILGSGLGWFLVLVAGTAGNAFNILLRTGQHLSVGFSTAVFGAIGILTGLELKRQFRIKGVLLPLGAGLSLLAMLGSGGERTDLGAHFWGLAVGCGIGVLVASFPVFLKWCNAWQRQLFFLAVSLLIVLGCWQLAFS